MIVLDTHVWIWWAAEPQQLSEPARRAIEDAIERRQLYLSCISVWEIAMLADRGRLELTNAVDDWIAASHALPFLAFVPVDSRIALRAVRLPGSFHQDPADRMIVATALVLGARVVTKDERMRVYPHVSTIW